MIYPLKVLNSSERPTLNLSKKIGLFEHVTKYQNNSVLSSLLELLNTEILNMPDSDAT